MQCNKIQSRSLKSTNVSGGFTQSDVWVQTLADITGKNLAILQADDASAVGAAFMALKSIGSIQEYPSVTADLKVFKPQTQNTEVHSRNFTIYKQLYSDLKDTLCVRSIK